MNEVDRRVTKANERRNASKRDGKETESKEQLG